MEPKLSQRPQSPKHPNNIRKVIKESPWKFYQVAEQTHIPRETLVDYCAGKYPVPSDRLQALAEFLGYPPEYLVPPLPNVRDAYRSHSQSEEAKDFEALLVLRTYCQQHPIDENALQQLMELLGKVGRYQEIEQCYERFLKELKKEDFWRKPDVCTTKLLEQLRAQKALAASPPTSENEEQVSQTNEVASKDLATSSQDASVQFKSKEPSTSLVSANPPPAPQKKENLSLETVLWLVLTHYPEFHAFAQQFQEAMQRGNAQPGVESALDFVNTSLQKEEASSPFDVQSQDIIGGEGGAMKKDRRNLTIALTGVPFWIPGIGQQDFIADVQHALRQPSLGLGDKELTYLEQKIRDYWLDYYSVAIAPADLVLHVAAYVRDVTTLLNRSLLSSIRMRLCACLSQGMVLIGVNCYAAGQFQTARKYFQTAQEAAHEAHNNILQAEAWCWDSYSWMRSNEPDRYQHALDSMLKACHFASLESDLAVQSQMLGGSAEVYGYLKEKTACLEALESATKLNGYGRGDYYHIHQFDSSHLNGLRGISLQQFYERDDPETHALLEEARQALEEALSQLGAVSLQRAFYVVDMAQLYAREGKVELACDHARQIIPIAGTSSSVRKKLWAVCTLLAPYEDVAVVKDLDREIRALLLAGK